jgi:hypothetical protein
VPVRERAFDLKRLACGHELLTGERPAHELDHALGQVREVAERLVLDLAALAVTAPQQVGDVDAVLVPRLDSGYVSGSSSARHRISA